VRANDGTELTVRQEACRLLTHATVRPTMSGRMPITTARRLQDLLARTVPVRRRTDVRRGRVAGVPVEVVRRAGTVDRHLLVYVHGGGFVVGSPRTHRAVAAALAHESGATVVVPGYRLAPEHPFPAAGDDVRAVYEALDGRAPERLTIAGDSAGGNLALGLALEAAADGLRPPDAVGAVSPLVDLAMPEGSLDTADDAILRRQPTPRFVDLYLGTHGDPRDPRCSPHLGQLHRLPPTLVQVGGAEALRDDATTLLEAAAAAAAQVHLQVWPGMWHVHQVLPGLLPDADRALADLGRFLATGDVPAGVRRSPLSDQQAERAW
jgi:epsilon-lactone hydrolase